MLEDERQIRAPRREEVDVAAPARSSPVPNSIVPTSAPPGSTSFRWARTNRCSKRSRNARVSRSCAGEQMVRDVVVGIEHDLEVRRRKALEQPEELDRRPEDVLDRAPRARGSRRRARPRRRARRATRRAAPRLAAACSRASPPSPLARPRPGLGRDDRRAEARRQLEAAHEEVEVRAPRRVVRARRGSGTRRARRSRFPRRRARATIGSTASGCSRHSSSSGPAELQRLEPEAPARLDQRAPTRRGRTRT